LLFRLRSTTHAAACALAWGLAGAAAAQAPGPEPSDATLAEATAPASGVISYPPSFFTQFQPANALDMINRIPGFGFQGGDQVRGFQGAVGNVLLDGQRPSTKSVTLENLLQRIPADEVQRVDLIRGGAPGIDMQGLPVIVNVVRKQGAGFSGTVELGAKTYEHYTTKPLGRIQATRKIGALTLDGTINIELGKSDFDVVDGRQSRWDGQGRYLNFGYVTIDMDDHLYQANGSVEYRRPKDLFHLNLGVERNNQPRIERSFLANLAGAQFRETLTQDIYNDKAEVGGDYERQLGAGVTAQVIGLYTYKTQEVISGFVTPSSSTLSSRRGVSGESILRTSIQGLTWHGVGFAAGIEGAFNTLDSTSGLTSNGVVQVQPSANVRVEEKRAEGFVTLSNKPTPKTSLELGVRVETSRISQSGDVDRSRSFTFAKPRAIFSWSPDKSSQIRLRVERVVGQLNFQDFAASGDLVLGAAAGNAELQPERAWIFEGAAEKRFWGQGAVVLTVTHRELQQVNDRVPIFTPAGVFDAAGNVARGTRDEYKLTLALPLDNLGIKRTQFRMSAPYRVSKTTDPVTGRERQIGGQRGWLADFALIHDVPRWRSTFTFQVQPVGYDQWFYRLTEQRQDTRPSVVRIFWNWNITKQWLFRLEGYNVAPKLVTRDRLIFAPSRAGTLTQREYRRLWGDQVWTLKLRRTF
jgi:hypothetical protein